MQGSEIQGLRSRGTGRGSRALITRQNRTQLLNSDPLYREMYESGINVSVRQ